MNDLKMVPDRRDLIWKRALDVIISLSMLVTLFPFFVLIALAIKLQSAGPVFFKSERVGINGRRFVLLKFRSMINGAINIGLGVETSKDDFRITRIGRFLRHWSLDELLQLINILKGEMSLVGPRPALPHQVEKYSGFETKRLEMRPGVTGWAQVNGRNLLSWKERIQLDVWYVQNWYFWLDFKILFMTIKVILTGEGLYGKEGMVKDYE